MKDILDSASDILLVIWTLVQLPFYLLFSEIRWLIANWIHKP